MTQTIVRIHKEPGKFFLVTKGLIENKNLSWKAKGLHCYLMSKPNDWQVYLWEIEKNSRDGIDSVRAGMKELEDAGYIQKHKKRDEVGRFVGWEWNVYEYPTETGFSDLGKTDLGKSNTTNNDSTENDFELNDDEEFPETPESVWEKATGIAVTQQISDDLHAAIDQWDRQKYLIPSNLNIDGKQAVIAAVELMGKNGGRSLNYIDKVLFSGQHAWIRKGFGYKIPSKQNGSGNKAKSKLEKNLETLEKIANEQNS